MSTAMPQVPPRPTRVHDQKNNGSTLGNDLPKIPPRPVRRIERSVSPHRESYARSPLNELPPSASQGKLEKSSLYLSESASTSSTELPHRPASIVLPSIGQEGSEYAEVFASSDELGSSPTQTRNIANDLKLHAPKPSLPVSSAKQRVETVTRTDSGQAAAFGIGKPGSVHSVHEDSEPAARSVSFSSQHSNGTERPSSAAENEHGIPQIGQVVPMYPNAGDVQAPSPSPFQQSFAPGIGFHNDGSQPRHHGRRTSGRGVEIPFDAYGKHGHGQMPHDRFEKAYYQKHPELLKKETGAYHGPFAEGRAEWAMSSDDLNKIVRDTASASRGTALGNSPAIIGTPSEEIGFQATEEYASRISSPRPQSSNFASQPDASQTHADSPLSKESFPTEGMGTADFEGSIAKSFHTPEIVTESEAEEEDTIHVDSHARKNKIYARSYHESTDSLGFVGEHSDEHEEHGYSAPILASDEVAKEPFGYELQPAVSPLNERNEGMYHHKSGSASSLGGSRPTSRPGSIHGVLPGFAVSSSTPLEDLDEYEPLFPEDGVTSTSKKPVTAADKLKRPDLKNRFPSKDIWEDSPNSLHYTATVSTPQLPEETEVLKAKEERAKETPEQAFARRQEELAEKESLDSDSFLSREKKPWSHKSHLVAETRPSLKQRFPSRDIWEDTPDSLQLQTTVDSPQTDDVISPPTPKSAAGLPAASDGSPTKSSAKPVIPARPVRGAAKGPESPEKSQPPIPERPSRVKTDSPPLTKAKPVVPARPAKPIARESSEHIPLTTVTSNSSTKSVGSDQGSIKSKPPVPSRPVGSKIAALQGGFMSDLNKRLQLGPQAPKKEESPTEEPEAEKEKAPLVDARKGRARGPARRAPAAKSPAPPAAATVEKSNTFGISLPLTLFEINPEEELLRVPSHTEDVPVSETTPSTETPAAPALATENAGEELHEPTEVVPEKALEAAHAETVKEAVEATAPASADDEVKQTTQDVEQVEDGGEDLSASTATVKAEPQDVDG